MHFYPQQVITIKKFSFTKFNYQKLTPSPIQTPMMLYRCELRDRYLWATLINTSHNEGSSHGFSSSDRVSCNLLKFRDKYHRSLLKVYLIYYLFIISKLLD